MPPPPQNIGTSHGELRNFSPDYPPLKDWKFSRRNLCRELVCGDYRRIPWGYRLVTLCMITVDWLSDQLPSSPCFLEAPIPSWRLPVLPGGSLHMSHFSYACKTEGENGISRLISALCVNCLSCIPEYSRIIDYSIIWMCIWCELLQKLQKIKKIWTFK